MRVLVTGAAGFSGRAIARWLAAEGHEVVAHWHTTPLPDDLAEGETWRADLAGDDPLPPKLDAIVHTAATSPATGAADTVPSARLIRDNAAATARLAAAEVGMFVYLSSLSVHGTITEPVVTPDTPVVNPDAYGMSKLLGERAVAERAGPALAIRLPAVIGRGAARNWPVQVLARLIRGETVRIFNGDAAFNNVVHVQDVAAFVSQALIDPPKAFAAVPVASRDPITVRKAVMGLAEAVGVAAAIEDVPAPKPSFTVDLGPAAALGFAPRSTAMALRDYAREEVR
ncbi:NAD-dependent epimerase/dehydratase family protein [Thalassobaculum sp. OXR-137]|uniref:NAD-dependent epimerase/dehydratase family protein n=1 Tax=Thalassobaculum sp. OXR-137 TaxID=3100173 RepID=UPI002AC99039|nr:NAD-dependent epimerase/dehydratase family protein [Thalassobaculum sp. OXR-137]WPZ36215.1 NAD-dependent epimerase/dehydratase family protein [Thalassobaculum sp. OXR-137]